jgi:hypothetical protein
MSERTEEDDPPKEKEKDPASLKQLDRIESGIGQVLDSVKKGKVKEDPPPAPTPPEPSHPLDEETDELDDFFYPNK